MCLRCLRADYPGQGAPRRRVGLCDQVVALPGRLAAGALQADRTVAARGGLRALPRHEIHPGEPRLTAAPVQSADGGATALRRPARVSAGYSGGVLQRPGRAALYRTQ
eukprot:scaffold2418_cov296-Prasinococcus_capsulatus_cf.AAC.4